MGDRLFVCQASQSAQVRGQARAKNRRRLAWSRVVVPDLVITVTREQTTSVASSRAYQAAILSVLNR